MMVAIRGEDDQLSHSGAHSSIWMQSECLISMGVIITTAVPIIALCMQDPYIHSLVIYMSDFSRAMAACHGLCGLIDMH